jgi:branched-chain amino acid transport system ATP-binding protein
MTARENLEVAGFSLRNRRLVRERIAEVMDVFPLLREKERDYAGNLSGGEQQIVELAMALVTKPSLLLVDEPSIGLAPMVVSQVLSVIQAINARGVTVVMVEQNARRALAVSHVGVVLARGAVRMERPADDMLSDDSVRREYLGGRGASSAPPGDRAKDGGGAGY